MKCSLPECGEIFRDCFRCGLVPSVEMKSFSDHIGSKCLVRAAVISASDLSLGANRLLNRVYVVGPIVVKSAGHSIRNVLRVPSTGVAIVINNPRRQM